SPLAQAVGLESRFQGAVDVDLGPEGDVARPGGGQSDGKGRRLARASGEHRLVTRRLDDEDVVGQPLNGGALDGLPVAAHHLEGEAVGEDAVDGRRAQGRQGRVGKGRGGVPNALPALYLRTLPYLDVLLPGDALVDLGVRSVRRLLGGVGVGNAAHHGRV